MMSVTILMGIVIMIIISTLTGNIISQKALTQTAETINQVAINVGNALGFITERVSYLAFNPTVQQQLMEDLKTEKIEAVPARRTLSPWLVQAYDGTTMNQVEIHGNSGQNYFISSNSTYGLSTMQEENKKNPEYQEYRTRANQLFVRPLVINAEHVGGNI